MDNRKLAFYYMRLSKEDGDVADGTSKESQSIASQRISIRQFIKCASGLSEQFEEVVDDGYSGTHFERPGIKRILRAVELGQVNTLIVRDLSRFARNYLEAGHYLEYVFPAYDVRFISINDGYDSADHNESTAGLHVAIKNLINQLYSRDLSIKIKSAVDMKKLRGEFVYGTAPFGYKKGTEKNTIIADDEAALIVRSIFTMACQGKTISAIARQLNEEGVITPSVYLAPVRGERYRTRSFWTYESVRNILINRIYTGDTVPFKSHVARIGSNRVKTVTEENQIVLSETHEAVISREMFFQAKQVVKSKRKTETANKPSVLASYLVCGCCGNRLSKGKPQNKAFLCASARYNPASGCKSVRCDEQKTKDILLRAIRHQCMMMESHLKMIKSAAKTQKNEAEAIKKDMQRSKRILDEAQAAKLLIYEELISGRLTKEEYLERKKELNERKTTAQMQVKLLEEKRQSVSAEQIKTDEIVREDEQLGRFAGITELDESLMRELVKKIVVYPDGSLHIVWNFSDITANENTTSVRAAR